ncbi:NAD(P)/FAD-dependent oxidoreductase [Paraburkholderia lacunae]|uniref:Pyridine nucleotide-disulfide oxidoreductase n=1 Tax=Paraburkholderia lacunae TaxID=2211104 RepID=A0A370N5H4_9BURK|nr:FAD-dependent oxidoreductase [Paraburkholderia lacunae]RDK00842.1 pyridine nucleotide-disulfide oxidoreductase [Paraburkholderia lacunae]
MSSTDPMVIVGGGQCGARAAHALRENGWDGAITLLGDEGLLPYERPPLSKSVLLGQKTVGQCAIYDKTFFRDQRVDVRVDASVTAIDRAGRKVILAGGDRLAYRRLLIATGAQPRRLDLLGATLPGVHVLRGAPDALAIADELLAGQRIAVIGAGFIGLEITAAAVARGCEVVVLEAAPRALMRAVPEAVANCLVERHRQMGVDVRFAVQVERIAGETRVSGVQLADGTVVPCDAVVAGIGVTPRTALAEAAGIDIANGIAVDETLRTSDPSIYAAGDVCSFPHPLFGRRIRLECWKNAEDQARVAARNMLGHSETCSSVPWFWSDQYDMTIQIAGLPALGPTTVVRETGAASRVFFSLDANGVLVGASGVGQTGEIARDVRIAQELIARRSCVEPALLADRDTKLRSLLVAQAS